MLSVGTGTYSYTNNQRKRSIFMAPAKLHMKFESGVKNNGRAFNSQRPPDVIPMVSYMNDHKKMRFPELSVNTDVIIDEPPFSSSTLIRQHSNKPGTSKTMHDKIKHQPEQPYDDEDGEEFDNDSLNNITCEIDHVIIDHVEIDPKVIIQEIEERNVNDRNEAIDNEIADIKQLNIPNATQRKLPPLPALQTPYKGGKKKGNFWRSASLPSSPFNHRKGDKDTSSPLFKRHSHSLRDRLRRSIKRKESTVNTVDDDPFPTQREQRFHDLAKKRGRRGAVISLEVSQSVSLVKSSSKEDTFLEFSFLPTTYSGFATGK